MRINRREAIVMTGSMGLALGMGEAGAASLSDWSLALSVGSRFIAAGIPARAFGEGSSSMLPTLQAGDVMLGDERYAGKLPRRGDIIAFAAENNTHWIKRVIGLPGERVSCRNWQFAINGEPMPLIVKGRASQTMFGEQVRLLTFEETPKDGQPYLVSRRETLDQDQATYGELAEVTVPADQLFVVGDCRSDSMDSRFPGMKPVRLADVLARIVFRERPNAGWLVPEGSVEGLAAAK